MRKLSSKKAATGRTGAEKKSSKSRSGGNKNGEIAVFDSKKWQAEDDSRTLTRATEILKDPSRVKAARKVAEEQAEAAQKAANAIKQIEPRN